MIIMVSSSSSAALLCHDLLDWLACSSNHGDSQYCVGSDVDAKYMATVVRVSIASISDTHVSVHDMYACTGSVAQTVPSTAVCGTLQGYSAAAQVVGAAL